MPSEGATLAQFTVASATAIAVVFFLTSWIKPFVELVVPPSSPLHDATIQLVAFALSIVIILGATAISMGLTPERIFLGVYFAFVTALSSIGGYNVATRYTGKRSPRDGSS